MKRVIAVLLCICMLCAMVPALAAEDVLPDTPQAGEGDMPFGENTSEETDLPKTDLPKEDETEAGPEEAEASPDEEEPDEEEPGEEEPDEEESNEEEPSEEEPSEEEPNEEEPDGENEENLDLVEDLLDTGASIAFSVLESGVYEIAAAEDLLAFAAAVKGGNRGLNAVLTADIDMSGTSWTSIGTLASNSTNASVDAYTGTFDGGGHTISGLHNPLFGALDGAFVKDLILADVAIQNDYPLSATGALSSGAYNSTLENVTIASGTVRGINNVGGLIAYAYDCDIVRCANHADVYGQTIVGGLTARVYATGTAVHQIYQCVNTGSVTSTAANSSAPDDGTGGLIGSGRWPGTNAAYAFLVTECANTGSVVGGSQYVGGFLGHAYETQVFFINCYNTGTVACTNSNAKYAGGFVGYSEDAKSRGRYLFNYSAAESISAPAGAVKGGFSGSLEVGQSYFYVVENYWLAGVADRGDNNGRDGEYSTASNTRMRIGTVNTPEELLDAVRDKVTQSAVNGIYYASALVVNPGGGWPLLSWQVCSDGHDYTAQVTAPTCTEKGYTTYTCKQCGASYTGNETPAAGHVWDEGELTVPPTCAEEGEMLYTCAVCGETRTEAVEKTEHNFSITQVTAPTCTEEGYTTHICQVCGESWRDEVVEALGHDYGKPEVTPARCTEDGLEIYTCQREDCTEECEGHTVTQVIPALGHEFVDGVCVHEGCGLTTAEACYWLAIETDARWAVSVTVTGEDGEAVQPDESGRWLLAKPAVYHYQITAENYLEEAGQFQWAGPLWSRGEDEEDGTACYTMRVELSPVSNTVVFQGSGVTVTVGGAAVTETEIAYGEDLEFCLDVPAGAWISSVKAVVEQPVSCADVWQGNIGTVFGGGSGTQANPYLISTCAQLALLAEMVNSGNTCAGVYFLLTENLDMDGRPWTPIGFRAKDLVYETLYPFEGVFDGGGHVIRNLTVDTSGRINEKNGGLFGALSGAQVKNLGLAQCHIRAGSYCGAVASTAKEGSVIENCWATGTVAGGTNYTGGIVGTVYSSSVVRNCWNGASVTRTNEALGGVGGIAGYVTAGTVADCWNIGEVKAGGSGSQTTNYGVALGGVAGFLYQAGTIENCCNSGAVTYTGEFYHSDESTGVYYGAGGVVGRVQSGTAIGDIYLRGCYNSGAVTANTGRAGGVVGNALCRLSAYIEITDCYNTGRVTMLDNAGYAGGLAGRVYCGTDTNYFKIMRCYSTGKVSAARGGGLAGSAQTVTLESCYALTGTADGLFFQNTGVANGSSVPEFVPASKMQTGEFIVLLSGGAEAFTDDLYEKNGGFPVLTWQSERPDVFGEYQELPVEEEDGVYRVCGVVQAVAVRIETCAALTEKQVVFDVQPSNLVSASLNIVVLDRAGAQVQPEAGTVQTFILTVGETYRYIITAEGFVTVEGTLAVTESSSRLVSVRMTEGGPSHVITFEGNRSHLTLLDLNDTPLNGTVRAEEGTSFGFYLAADEGYRIASVRLSGGEAKLDVWDGVSADITWYIGNGNQKEYTLTTAAQLMGLSLLVGQGFDFDGVTIYLDADLDLSAGSFYPIGSCDNVKQDGTIVNIAAISGTPFRGTFSGNGHTVTVSISQTAAKRTSYLGLFGWLEGAVVENLTIAGSIQGHSYSAAVAGLMHDSTIRNCVNQAKVAISEYGGAGIVGRACGECKVLNCRNEGPVTGGSQIAGIVSNACKYVGGNPDKYVLVQGCQNTGKIMAIASIYGLGAGGIAISGVHLESCSNSGTIVSAASWNGGLTAQGAESMRNCYNTGDIYCEKEGGLFSNTNYVGGLMGSGSCLMVMENCYNAGLVSFTGGTGGAAGSLAGSLTQGRPENFLNNYWVTGTSAEAICTINGVTIIATERQIKEVGADELRRLFSTLGDNAWREDVTGSNNGYPVLRNTPPVFAFCTLEDLGDGVYQIPAVNQDVTVCVTVLKLLDALELNAAHLELAQGDMFQLIPGLVGADAENWTVTWSSSDETVAVVNSAGVVTALGVGTAVMTAEAGGKTAECTVTVTRKMYPVTLSGAVGEASAAEGQDYTGMIEDYGEQYVYTVVYQVGEKTAKAALDTSTGMFTIPGEDVTGALTVTVTKAEIGFALERFEDFASGYTLVVIPAEQGTGYCYHGQPMFYVEAYGGYAWLIGAGDTDGEITIDNGVECVVIERGDCDVNRAQPSRVDFNDALCAFACYNGLEQFPVSQWMEMYLRSDVNGDHKIDADDISEILKQGT